jgi:hypothetical protein
MPYQVYVPPLGLTRSKEAVKEDSVALMRGSVVSGIPPMTREPPNPFCDSSREMARANSGGREGVNWSLTNRFSKRLE